MRMLRIIPAMCLSLAVAAQAFCEEGVQYLTINGIKYKEIRETVRRPTAKTEYEERQQTVYRQKVTTDTRESKYTVYVPITHYRWEAYRTGVFNPFAPVSTAYRWVPDTRWEPRTATVSVPVTQQRWVPETQTVKVPVRTLMFVDEERVRKVAVSTPSPSVGAAATATRPQYGSVGRLDSDPPRVGPRGATIRR
jgi:hypothetical protein